MALRDPELQQLFDEKGQYRRRGVVIVLVGCGGQGLEGVPFNTRTYRGSTGEKDTRVRTHARTAGM